MPILIQAYQSDKGDDTWNNQVYISFLNHVAEDLKTKIEQKIGSINNQEDSG